MRVVDLTHVIQEDMPVYPGTETPKFLPGSTYDADGFKETCLQMFTHTGTHMDPPAHLFANGMTLDEFPASQFIGKAVVVDCRGLGEGEFITMEHVRACGDAAEEADFLLFNTGWDQYWGSLEYFGEYPCIDDEVLDFILAGDYKGIGFDVIGLDPIADENLTRHKRLFAHRAIVNIENLTNLDACGRGLFHLSCFPLPLKDGDGSPVRAVAWFC